MRKELVIETIEMAIQRRKLPKTLIARLRIQAAGRYASYAYQELVAKNGFKSSICAKCDPWNNAVVENFFGTFKTELIHSETWDCEKKMGVCRSRIC